MTTTVMSGTGVLSAVARENSDLRCPGCERMWRVSPCFPGCSPIRTERQRIVRQRLNELEEAHG